MDDSFPHPVIQSYWAAGPATSNLVRLSLRCKAAVILMPALSVTHHGERNDAWINILRFFVVFRKR